MHCFGGFVCSVKAYRFMNRAFSCLLHSYSLVVIEAWRQFYAFHRSYFPVLLFFHLFFLLFFRSVLFGVMRAWLQHCDVVQWLLSLIVLFHCVFLYIVYSRIMWRAFFFVAPFIPFYTESGNYKSITKTGTARKNIENLDGRTKKATEKATKKGHTTKWRRIQIV